MTEEAAIQENLEQQVEPGAATTPEPAPQAGEPSANEPGEKKPDGIQKRFNEMTRHRRELESANQDLENDNQTLKQKLELFEKIAPQQPAKPEGKPRVEDFETYEDFTEALTDWKVEEKELQRAEQRKTEAAKQTKIEKQQRLDEVLFGVEKQHEEFPEMISRLAPRINDQLIDVVMESEIPGRIFFHLGSNPDFAATLAGKTPLQQTREILRLEQQISAAKPTTNAPEPPDPLKGGDVVAEDADTLLKKNPKEWIRRRNEGKI